APAAVPEGRLVDVGGRRLWIACAGEGDPTVIMDAGVSTGSAGWTLVAPRGAALTRGRIYDRAGVGRRDPAPPPRSSRDIVDDLHRLLTNAGVAPPYVLVAHSFAGLTARLYASQYPAEVAGLVLVDPLHEDRFARMATVLSPTRARAFEQDR